MSNTTTATADLTNFGAQFLGVVTSHPYICALIALFLVFPGAVIREYFFLAIFGVLRLFERIYEATLGRLFAPPLRYIPKGSVKRVAVIGAGASGITAAKEALNAGFEVTVFEQTDTIGGNWVFRETETHASVYRSTFINTSKQMMVYSDYPMPLDFPTFPSHEQIVKYFRDYAAHFKVTRNIRFKTQVLDVSREDDNDPNNTRWVISHTPSTADQKPLYLRSRDGRPASHQSAVSGGDHKASTGSGGGDDSMTKLLAGATKETFDAVFVANGHHSVPRWPDFPGQSSFKGHIMHSHSYKDPRSCNRGYDFHGKKVVVVGIGNSGVDIANELSHCVAKEVVLSTRSGAWIWPKFIRGLAMDHILTPPRWKIEIMPKFLRGSLSLMKQAMVPVQALITEHFGDQKTFGLSPPSWLLGVHPTISQELLHRIGTGTIKIAGDVARINETSVEFKDGQHIKDVDAIVFCTGYHISFPFLKQKYQPVRTNRVSIVTGKPEEQPASGAIDKIERKTDASDPLGGNGVDAYKAVFSPHLPPTLVHIGLFQPLGAIMPISEMQARWVCGVWQGRLGLVSPALMQLDCDAFARAQSERYLARPRHTIQRDGLSYMPELASLIGCEPNMLHPRNWSLRLWYLLILTPAGWPATYRLNGPDRWDGAHTALQENWDQIWAVKTSTARTGLDDQSDSSSASNAVSPTSSAKSGRDRKKD